MIGCPMLNKKRSKSKNTQIRVTRMLRRAYQLRHQMRAAPQALRSTIPNRSSDPAHAEISKQRDDITRYSNIKNQKQADEAGEQLSQLLMAEMDKINKENEANEQKIPLKRNLREIQRRYREARGVPLLHRWWIPPVTVAFTIFIWLPTKWKVDALLWLDHTHDDVKWYIHTTYWKYTMEPDQYALLMEQMEAGIQKSKRVQSPNCPL